MIKLQEHIVADNQEVFLRNLAERMWDNLGDTLIENLEYVLEFIQNPIYLESDLYDKDINMKDRQLAFLQYLCDEDYQNLRQLITASPEELFDIKIEIENIFQDGDLYTMQGQTKFGKYLIDSIFKYSNFRSSVLCIELYKELDLVTCLYCNQQKTKIIRKKDDNNQAYFQLDHFYSKSQYPYFAISFFNLIPCCSDCNTIEKGDAEFCINTHINPYHKAFDDVYKFEFSIDASELTLIIQDGSDNKMVVDLSLQSRYNGFHLDEATALRERYKKNRHKLNDGDEFTLEGILWDTPIERKNILRVERGKMKRDILKSLGAARLLTT